MRIDRLLLTGDEAAQFLWSLKAAHFTPEGTPDSPLGRCLGAQAIAQVLQRVQRSVIQQGYPTTRILAGAQSLADGTLTLTIIPGRIGAIKFDNVRATAWNAFPMRAGDTITLTALGQALDNLRRLPTVHAEIEITPGTAPGESELSVRWQQDKPWRLAAFVDDGGSRQTGKIQGGATLAWDHLFSLNDVFYLSASRELAQLGGIDPGPRGSRAGTVHYSLPWDYWLLEFNHSRYHFFQAVAGLNQALVFSGESRNSSLKLSRTLHRSSQLRTAVSVKAWLRSSRNFVEDVEVEAQRRRMAGWELSLNQRQATDAATLELDLTYRHGTGAFNATAAPEASENPGISRPQLIHADLQFEASLARLEPKLRYRAALRAQWNRTHLVPQDQFAIGGRYTVRGFDGERLLTAERGWLMRNELALPLRDTGQEIYLGLDHGEVAGPSATYLIGTRLTGSVLGWRGNVQNIGFDLFMGRPVKKPAGFQTASLTGGFNLNWKY